MNEGDVENRGTNLSPPSEYRVRRDDTLAFRAAFIILGGLLAVLGFFWTFSSQLREAVLIEIRNERVERINSDNRIEQRIQNIEQRRGW